MYTMYTMYAMYAMYAMYSYVYMYVPTQLHTIDTYLHAVHTYMYQDAEGVNRSDAHHQLTTTHYRFSQLVRQERHSSHPSQLVHYKAQIG